MFSNRYAAFLSLLILCAAPTAATGQAYLMTGAGTGGAGALPNTTWNPADAAPAGGVGVGIQFSNGNLTAGLVNGGSNAGTRSTSAKALGSSGKIYFECQYTVASGSTPGNQTGCGIAASTFTLGSTNTTNAAFYVANAANTGDIRINNSTVVSGTVGGLTVGGFIGIAIDFSAKLFWATVDGTHWNSNSVTNDPGTGTGGQSIAAISSTQFACLGAAGSVSTTRELTANFGATAFHYTVPTGFAAWH